MVIPPSKTQYLAVLFPHRKVNIKEKQKQSTKNKEEKEMNVELSFSAEKRHQPICIAFCIHNSHLFHDDYITNFSGDFMYFIHELETMVTMLTLFHFN